MPSLRARPTGNVTGNMRHVILLCGLAATIVVSVTSSCRRDMAAMSSQEAERQAEGGTISAFDRLGREPLCEASAALRAPWQDGLVLVADNELGDRLFGFSVDAEGRLSGQQELPLPGPAQVEDIEALAAIDKRLLVIGSHGRSGKRCTPRPARQLIQLVSWDAATGRLGEIGRISSAEHWQTLTSITDACLEGLFTAPPPAHAEQVCAAIVEAEAGCGPEDCRPMDIEAASTVDERIWLGLRQPRLGVRAVLLRLVPSLDELRFDGVVLLAVGDRGIRGLESNGEHLWAILGPAPEATDRSSLWRAPLAEIQPGATLSGELVSEGLPPSSEGLVLAGTSATVITDGAEPDGRNDPCKEPAHQITISL